MKKYWSKIIERIPFVKKKTDEIAALNEEIEEILKYKLNLEEVIVRVHYVCGEWKANRMGNLKAISQISEIFNRDDSVD